MAPGLYGEVTIIFSWFAIFNVVLAYGMETAFFRFYAEAKDKNKVISTALLSVLSSAFLFAGIAFIFREEMASLLSIAPKYVDYVIGILVLDALVIIPFAWLRATEKPMKYAIIKIANVSIYLFLNVFFLLLLPEILDKNAESSLSVLYKLDFEISYILISNLCASGITLLLMVRMYFRKSYIFNIALWKRMMRYAIPVMIAGIAFTINEVFDRIMLDKFLPLDPALAKAEIGKYAACYKIALFMTLFATAFRLGIEPFFFSHASSKNPQKAYAQITNYFVILGSIILLGVIVFADVLKYLFVLNSDYWDAMSIVPIIVLASFFLGIYHNLSVWYKVTDKTRYGAFISVVGAIITIGINYLFIPKIGYMASALATLAAYASMMLLSYFYGKKHYPIPYNLRKIIFYWFFR